MAEKSNYGNIDREDIDRENIDKEDMKSVLAQFPEHCEDAIKLGKNLKFNEKFDSVVICGMGGSAISGDLLKNVLGEVKTPMFVVRDYNLPAFVKSRSLVFTLSYSGNTEETISCFHDAIGRACRIVAISSGGKLAELAEEKGAHHIDIPSGIQPRLATAYLFFPMLNVLRNAKIADISADELRNLVNYFSKAKLSKNAEEIAEKIYGKVPVIYASPRFAGVAMKWKTDINENAKVHAFYNVYPEFNHNEINAFVSRDSDYYVIILRDADENRRIAKRMDVTGKLIKKYGANTMEIMIKGDSMLRKVMSAMLLGLWISYYLALLYGTDPTPVEIIEDLKKELRK